MIVRYGFKTPEQERTPLIPFRRVPLPEPGEGIFVAETAGTRFQYEEAGQAEKQLPLVIAVPEMPGDELVRRRAERFVRTLGAQAVRQAVEGSGRFENRPESRYPTLMHEIHAAAQGDGQAQFALAANAATEMSEIGYKEGHRTQVALEVEPDGTISQYGQRLLDVYANILQLVPQGLMRLRTSAETANGFRMMDVRRQGLLKEYAFVVFSRYPDDMGEAEADKAGFFVETKSCSIQALYEWGGKLVQDSAFVAGVRTPGAERHDRVAIEGIGAELGVPLAGKDALATIATPLLVHRSLMPDGVVDLVKRYDRYAGSTFFGTAKPPEDYIAYLGKCREREEQLKPRVQAVVNELMAESGRIQTPLGAFKRLHELAQRSMVDLALQDASIDARVFGVEAADYIRESRLWLGQGDYGRFMQAREGAQSAARSSSCPAGIAGASGEEASGGEAGAADGGSRMGSAGERRKMNCPFCGATQYGDPCSPNQYCSKCTARVANGRVVSRGNGGREPERTVSWGGLEVTLLRRRKESGRRQAGKRALAA